MSKIVFEWATLKESVVMALVAIRASKHFLFANLPAK